MMYQHCIKMCHLVRAISCGYHGVKTTKHPVQTILIMFFRTLKILLQQNTKYYCLINGMYNSLLLCMIQKLHS